MITRARKQFDSSTKNCKYIGTLIVLLIFSITAYAQGLNWTEVASGVWRGVIGKPEEYDLIKASGSIPNKVALAKMGTVKFPSSQNDIAGTINDGKTYLRFA